MKSIDTLVYVENSWQVEGLQKLLKNKKQQDFIILAISPSAQTKLLELNIPFTKSTSFFSKEDHIRVVEKGSKIIDLLEKNFELELNENGQFESNWRHGFFTERVDLL